MKLTVKEVAEQLNMSVLFLREWIDSGKCPFGVCVQFKGSKKRTFNINAERYQLYREGKL